MDLHEALGVLAAAFLMPEEGLREHFSEASLLEEGRICHLSRADIVRAMDDFGVSRQALLYRLQNVRLLDEERAEELRKEDFSVMRITKKLGITFRAHRRFGSRPPPDRAGPSSSSAPERWITRPQWTWCPTRTV